MTDRAREVIAGQMLSFVRDVLRDYDVPEDAFLGDPELAQSCNVSTDAILAAFEAEGLAVIDKTSLIEAAKVVGSFKGFEGNQKLAARLLAAAKENSHDDG